MERFGLFYYTGYDVYATENICTQGMSWPGEENRPADFFVGFIGFRRIILCIQLWAIEIFSASDEPYELIICGVELAVTIYPNRVRRQMGLA